MQAATRCPRNVTQSQVGMAANQQRSSTAAAEAGPEQELTGCFGGALPAHELWRQPPAPVGQQRHHMHGSAGARLPLHAALACQRRRQMQVTICHRAQLNALLTWGSVQKESFGWLLSPRPTCTAQSRLFSR